MEVKMSNSHMEKYGRILNSQMSAYYKCGYFPFYHPSV